MPNRLIHESSRQSETLAQLSDFGERLFWRLVTVADDYGRFNASPMVVRAHCFAAMLDRIGDRQIAEALVELAHAGAVRLYRVGEKQLGEFAAWLNYQQCRAKKSKYPGPEHPQATAADLQTFASNCCRLGSAPNTNTFSDTNTIPNTNTNPDPPAVVTPTRASARPALLADFDGFWRVYPRKDGKQYAAQCWSKLNATEKGLAMEDVPKRVAANWAGKELDHIPHASTYLNQKRWTDTIQHHTRLPDPRPRLSPGMERLGQRYQEAVERERATSNQAADAGQSPVVETTGRSIRSS